MTVPIRMRRKDEKENVWNDCLVMKEFARVFFLLLLISILDSQVQRVFCMTCGRWSYVRIVRREVGEEVPHAFATIASPLAAVHAVLEQVAARRTGSTRVCTKWYIAAEHS